MTTQAKVIIPREVADAIEYFRAEAGSNDEIAYTALHLIYDGEAAKSLRKIPFDMLMRALLDGYERELTEEEKRYQEFRDVYALHCGTYPEIDNAYAAGMMQALIILRIVIPGINDAEGADASC